MPDVLVILGVVDRVAMNAPDCTWSEHLLEHGGGMRRVESVEEFLAAPGGRYVVSRGFAALCPRPNARVIMCWGDDDERELARLGQVVEAFALPQQGGHRCLVDVRHVAGIDPRSFSAIVQYLTSRSQRLATITQLAVVRSDSFSGALISGLCSTVLDQRPVRLFDALETAAHWLELERAAELCALMRDIRDAQRGDPLLGRLRLLLSQAPFNQVSLQEAAQQLCVSRRTLQRRLAAAGTTFQCELRAARLGLAKQLMVMSRLSLTAIALELGFASLQHFSSVFRAVHGMPPSRWRSRGLGNSAQGPSSPSA